MKARGQHRGKASMNIEVADISDLDPLYSLINLAYREQPSWTRENSLVSGIRISRVALMEMLASEQLTFLVCRSIHQIVGTICLDTGCLDTGCLESGADHCVTFSLFAVSPERQGQGIGSGLFTGAEQYAITELEARKLLVNILSPQSELETYYLRRHYLPSGFCHPFPAGNNVGHPLIEGMLIKQLEKSVSGAQHC
ncbi:GNAT family N-acetyltransferase [Spongorhabdus nitratireducens]